MTARLQFDVTLIVSYNISDRWSTKSDTKIPK